MDPMEAEDLLRKLDRRLRNVEQILPTLPPREEMRAAIAPLATREEMRAAIAPLATREEMRAAIAPLATREEMRKAIAEAIAPLATREEMHAAIGEEGERTRRHFDVVAESLRDDIRLIAESQVATINEVRQARKEINGTLRDHEKRITRLEASDARKRTRKNR